jgi:hypothetical protein
MSIAPNLAGQIGLAAEILKSAKHTFSKPHPSRNELIEAAVLIAWVVRRADKLGLKREIQPFLEEVRVSAVAAAESYRKSAA